MYLSVSLKFFNTFVVTESRHFFQSFSVACVKGRILEKSHMIKKNTCCISWIWQKLLTISVMTYWQLNCLLMVSNYYLDAISRLFIKSLPKNKNVSNFSTWKNIISAVPQGSILGFILFKTFMCSMFLFLYAVQLTGYSNDDTPFVVKANEQILFQLHMN